MDWEVIAVLAIIALFYIGRKRKTSYVGEFVIGVLYGLWWEFMANADFNYTSFSVYIYKDIPLAIILLWGVAIAGFIMISDYLQEKYPLWKKGRYSKLKTCLIYDASVASIIGWTMEYLGSHQFAMWTYPADLISIAGIPIRWIAGWFFVGVFVLAFIRRYQELFEIKSIEKKIERK